MLSLQQQHPRTTTVMAWPWPCLTLLSTSVVVALDLVSKHWVHTHLPAGQPIVLWPGVFQLTYVINQGGAFSLLHHNPMLLTSLSGLMLIALIAILVWFQPKTWGENLGFGAMIGGALGNLWERLFMGGVTDFLDVCAIHYPIFNVADSFICLGVAGLIGYYVWHRPHVLGS